MIAWDWQAPGRLIVGPGSLSRLGELLTEERVLLVTSQGWRRRGIVGQVCGLLPGVEVAAFDEVEPNPDIDALDAVLPMLREARAALILAVGGGSAIDTAKGLAVALPAPGWGFDAHFRGGKKLPKHGPLPILAVPTTAGTGAEVTPFATIWDKAARQKHSLQSDLLIPRGVILDAELTLGLPRATTIASGLDALSHAFEALWNVNASNLSDGFALQALRLLFRHLPMVVEQPRALAGRAAMLEASLLAGMAIAQTRTALVHSMSYPLTAVLGVPHGLACGAFLAGVLAYNVEADDGRIARAAQALGFGDIAGLRRALDDLLARLGLADALAAAGVSRATVEPLAGQMINPARAGNNLRSADMADVRRLLSASLG
ncbi:phosphonoacetaldehyde reductase [Oceanibaculum pacificum]|uniref:Uncharacterized protein n=1 Tax=Oceanibaculum pacificum TaxID=580166 RepID=A0A154WFA5_9PROT|nr:phosphonoacetaldehyde reductase [Oceanibaculum pacificum]KZD12213.1 hypothetical protein AUP43_05260 [Oceanibaculum pacificum]